MADTKKSIILNGRLINKHDTAENWDKAENFYPRLGEIIVYDPDATHPHPRCKIGIWDGNSTPTSDMLVKNLPFANSPLYTIEYEAANECLTLSAIN